MDGRRDGFPPMHGGRRDEFPTMHGGRRDEFPPMHGGRRDEFPPRQDGPRDDFPRTREGRSNGFAAAGEGGTPFIEVAPPEVPSSSGWSVNSSKMFSYLNSFVGRPNSKSGAEGGSSGGGIRGELQRPQTGYGGQSSEHSRQSYYKWAADFESEDAHGSPNGKGFRTRAIDDLQPIFAGKDNGMEFSFREKVDTERSENRIKHLENGIKQLEDDFLAKTKSLYLEKMRADDFEKENREYQGKLKGLHLEKMRADNLEKENRELQGKLKELYLEKVRADNMEKENRDYLAKLKSKEQEVGEFQLKLQDQVNAAAALEVKHAEFNKLQTSLQEVLRENQELKNWRKEQENKIERDLNTAGQLDTKVSDLTTAIGQLENKKQELASHVQEQSKRIQELKQKISVLEVKMGAKESESQSLRDRLHDERDKSSKLSDELQERNIQIEELLQVAQDLEQQNLNLMAQMMTADNESPGNDRELRERARIAERSVLDEQVGSREIEITQNLKTRLHQELENPPKSIARSQQRDLQIDDLKHLNRNLEKRKSESVEYIGGESYLETEATPYLLDGAVQRVHEIAGIFSRLLMKAMEQGKIDGMAVARNNFVRSVSLGKAAPLKYVLEAITCKLLFQGFEHECFDLQDSTSGFMDMEQQRMDNFRQYQSLCSMDNTEQLVLSGDSLFTYFCRTKLENLSEAIPEIESMVKEIISLTFDRSFSSEDTSTDVATYLAAKLGTTFVKLAVCVWQVHKLAFSFNPLARIFRVSQSEKFVEEFMESVIFQESESEEDEDMPNVDISRVDFMVVPGFLIKKIVVRSRVFVVTKPMSSTVRIPHRS